jgi:hypothetical protein
MCDGWWQADGERQSAGQPAVAVRGPGVGGSPRAGRWRPTATCPSEAVTCQSVSGTRVGVERVSVCFLKNAGWAMRM